MIIDDKFGEFNKKKDDIYFNKELNLYLITNLDKLSRKALGFSPTDGFTKVDEETGQVNYFVYGKEKKNKKQSTGGFYIKLSDIMEDEVDEKYYLKKEQVEKLMNN